MSGQARSVLATDEEIREFRELVARRPERVDLVAMAKSMVGGAWFARSLVRTIHADLTSEGELMLASIELVETLRRGGRTAVAGAFCAELERLLRKTSP